MPQYCKESNSESEVGNSVLKWDVIKSRNTCWKMNSMSKMIILTQNSPSLLIRTYKAKHSLIKCVLISKKTPTIRKRSFIYTSAIQAHLYVHETIMFYQGISPENPHRLTQCFSLLLFLNAHFVHVWKRCGPKSSICIKSQISSDIAFHLKFATIRVESFLQQPRNGKKSWHVVMHTQKILYVPFRAHSLESCYINCKCMAFMDEFLLPESPLNINNTTKVPEKEKEERNPTS